MKRVNQLFFGSALALLAGASLTACSSSDDVTDAPVNPSYDGKSVKTQFAINIATPSNSKTRMSDVNTQNGGNFLGMDNIYLIPFVEIPTESKYVDGTHAGSTPETSKEYTFPSDVLKLTAISKTEIDNSTDKKNYKIYNDVSIPVGTKNFLFYGTGPMTKKVENGALTVADISSTSGNTTNKIKFSLVDIATTDGANHTLTTVSEEFAAYLTTIANATGWAELTDDETLRQARTNLITNPSNGGVRAVSAAALKQIVQDIVTLAYPKRTPNGGTGTTVSKVADAICAAVKAKYFDISDVTGPEGKVDWKSTGVESTIKTFPRTLNIPEGAMLMTWDNTNSKFIATATPSMGTTSGSSPFINFYNLTYPACIAYRANTPLAAKNSEEQTWPTQYTTWENYDWTTYGWGEEVIATTRSIALQNNIQYGVAQLEATVIAASNLLKDNSENNMVSVTANAFPVTGILIGGQKSDVNWEYLPNSTATDKVVYDSDIKNIYLTTTESSSFYTLLFDSYTFGATTDQSTIRVALELENKTGADFKGVDGVVAAGQRFYLLAELDPNASSGVTAINWPRTNLNRFPQFGIDRTFVQDFKTKVKFTVSTLKNAYVTIPDLRSVKLQLGLSVDLQWQNGLTFDVPLGGTTN